MIVRHKLKALAIPLAMLMVAVGIAAGCGSDDDSGSSSNGDGGAKLTIVGYSVAREVYADLIPAFQATPEGSGVTFEQSYGASGEQSRAVADGLAADVVAFSFEPDITRLTDAGLVDADWNANADKGFVSSSVVVFIVRKGNPKGITTWDDLTKPGVEVITPNPFTSGAAQWNILAGYGTKSNEGKDEAAGLSYIDALFKNVPVQPSSGREALQVFQTGKGDVLLSYENEAIAAQQAGEDLDYVIPEGNILIQNPDAVVNTTKSPTQAKAFVDFLHTEQAQKIFGEHGYRPVNASVASTFDFPEVPGLFTIDDLGGWPKIRTELFDPEDGQVTKIFEGQGIATSK
ncbi:MAG: sulfate ABC transporter substrate-binding protein [Thermoleophilia bacterium]